MSPPSLPLSGCRVLERSQTVATAYAGRLLAAMGAEVVMLEPIQGTVLRNAPPFLQETGESALFAYLAAGKHSLVSDALAPEWPGLLDKALQSVDIFLDDTPIHERKALGLNEEAIRERFPKLVHVSVLPFGSAGAKADWQAEEINLLHSGGEGFLLPNGLSNEMFPERPPLKIYGHFAGYQGGSAAALAALAAWWVADVGGGQYVDVSVQDAVLSVGAFALQRLGDGSLEHRHTRRFRYGGVFQTKDGFIELLTLEDRQWGALVELLGRPAWSQDPGLQNPLERSRRGDEINAHIREWMAVHTAEEIVRRAQELGVPAGKYRTPAEVIQGEHERERGLFAPTRLQSGMQVDVLVAPFQFRATPLKGADWVPAIGEMRVGCLS